jgi:hypothetical protein
MSASRRGLKYLLTLRSGNPHSSPPSIGNKKTLRPLQIQDFTKQQVQIHYPLNLSPVQNGFDSRDSLPRLLADLEFQEAVTVAAAPPVSASGLFFSFLELCTDANIQVPALKANANAAYAPRVFLPALQH